jgi:hypothetical protein
MEPAIYHHVIISSCVGREKEGRFMTSIVIGERAGAVLRGWDANDRGGID